MITSLPGDDAVDCPDKVSCSPENMLPDNSMRPNLWFVNEKNKKPQKIFRKPKNIQKNMTILLTSYNGERIMGTSMRFYT